MVLLAEGWMSPSFFQRWSVPEEAPTGRGWQSPLREEMLLGDDSAFTQQCCEEQQLGWLQRAAREGDLALKSKERDHSQML